MKKKKKFTLNKTKKHTQTDSEQLSSLQNNQLKFNSFHLNIHFSK